MEKETDINKVVRQHLEMDDFFTGGFTKKAKTSEPEPLRPSVPVKDSPNQSC